MNLNEAKPIYNNVPDTYKSEAENVLINYLRSTNEGEKESWLDHLMRADLALIEHLLIELHNARVRIVKGGHLKRCKYPGCNCGYVEAKKHIKSI